MADRPLHAGAPARSAARIAGGLPALFRPARLRGNLAGDARGVEPPLRRPGVVALSVTPSRAPNGDPSVMRMSGGRATDTEPCKTETR
jgi:hypothetical protein